nr:uncharacterized protein si:ch211-66e2.5 [Nothobranchius furzeri]
MLRFLFFLLPHAGLPVSACGIMFTPPKVVVRYGDPVDANCTSLSCHNVTGMGWESPYGAVRLTKNVSSLPYKIDKVKDWEITSHCYISFSDNQSQRHEILPITVYKMPANVSVTNPPEHLLEGVTYFLKCDVRDVAPAQNLSVFWLGKKGELKKETFSEDSFTPLDVASSLDLTPRRDDHGSEIRCEARLDVFPDGGAPLTMQSQPLVLNVLYPPNFLRPENETLERSHSSMTFDCTAAGNPKPVYNWSFASSTHPEEQIKNMNKAALSPELVLSGTYSCTASNTLGSKTKYFIITEAEGNRTVFVAILAGFIFLGAVLFLAGLHFVTPDGKKLCLEKHRLDVVDLLCYSFQDLLVLIPAVIPTQGFLATNLYPFLTKTSQHEGRRCYPETCLSTERVEAYLKLQAMRCAAFWSQCEPHKLHAAPEQRSSLLGSSSVEARGRMKQAAKQRDPSSPPSPKSAGREPCFVPRSLQSCQGCSSWNFLSFDGSVLNKYHGKERSSVDYHFLPALFRLDLNMSGEGCSLILKPSRVVVGFGESVSVSCEATRPVRVLGWESAIGTPHTQEDQSVQWKVDSLIDWIEEPICYGVFFKAPRQCEEKLNLVLYKSPDSVSIRLVNHTGPMMEGKEYQLLCEVQNVAPVQYLTLRWYRGQTEVYKHSFSDLTSSSPVQVSSTLVITPTKAENEAEYKCVAELELGPEGPQPPPTVSSEPLTAYVLFPPTFFSPETEVLELTEGDGITLNCTAAGNPAPAYSWQSSHPIEERVKEEAVITSSSLLPGTYTCAASNTLEKKSKQFIVKAKTKGV